MASPAASVSDPPALTVSRLQALSALCVELPTSPGLPTLAVRVAQGLSKLVGFDQFALVMQAPDGKRWGLLRPRLATGPEPGWIELTEPDATLDEAMTKGQPAWRNESGPYMLPPGFEAASPIRELSLFPAALCVPLRGDTGIIGGVGIFAGSASYTVVDLHVLSLLVPIVEAVARELVMREDVARLKQEVEEGERMRGEVVSLLQGDLRNPLVVIDNGLDFLQSAMLAPTAQEARDHVEELRLVASTLVEMLDTEADLLGLDAKWIGLVQQPLRLEPWVKEHAQRKLAAARLAEVQLLARAEPGDAVASFDAGLMGRVVDNLLINAIRHTPRKGQVAFVVRRSGSGVTLAIGDTGAPIPADQRDSLFERTTFAAPDAMKPPSRSYGLAFCKAVVEAHGGTISIESPAGVGNLFRIALPL